MLEAENDFAEGRYFNATIHFLDACAEAFFDIWAIDRILSPEAGLTNNAARGTRTDVNLQAVNQLSSVLDIDKRIAEVFFEIGKRYPESAVTLANNCIEYCKNFGNPAVISTIFSNMKKSGGGKVLGDVMNYVSELIISIPYRTNEDKDLFMILTQIQNFAGTFRD